MSVGEQANLFSQASIVCSPHGAALANLVFCKEGTKVLELINDHIRNPLYFELSQRMNLDYRFMWVDKAEDAPSSVNYWVDPIRFEKALSMLSSRSV